VKPLMLSQQVKRNSIRNSIRIVAALTILSASSALLSQVPTGTISGTVHDRTGAVIRHATVGLQNEATGDKRTATTNSSGFFSFSSLLSGDYDIVVNAPTFGSFEETHYHLDPGDSRALNEI
jgi:Carboxypeptidase regulatory-like domain